MKNSGKLEELDSQATMEDLDELLDSIAPGSGLSWRLSALNEALGDLRKSNFCLFAGRPESGKTTLMCSEITHMAPQLPPDEKVLYFTNEEGGKVVKTRLYSSLLGVDLKTLLSNRTYYANEYQKALGGDRNKIIVIDKHDMHVNDIEYWLNREEVGLICIDQLRKVRGFDDIKGIQRLERLFQQAREWSKEYAPVLTVSQLDNMAENKQYPDMSMLYESKTAVQGECDVIVNIGQISGSVPAYARWLNIVKNKMPTPGDPAMRHGRYEVQLHPDIARYTG
jgi:replicative DNA helicase